MRPYYYLLFRIYRFYKDTMREKTALLFTTTAVSTLLLYFNFLTFLGLYGIMSGYTLPHLSKPFLVLILGVASFVNYYIFVRRKNFLDFGFHKDVKGGVFILLYFLITLSLFIIVANTYRSLF